MGFEQAMTVSGTGLMAGLVRQLQLSTGGVVSTTVTVWLQEAVAPQPSAACQVVVMTSGQVPLVTTLRTVITAPPGTPATGQQTFVAVGGSKPQLLPHCTVLLAAQFSAKGPGEITVKLSTHDAALDTQS